MKISSILFASFLFLMSSSAYAHDNHDCDDDDDKGDIEYLARDVAKTADRFSDELEGTEWDDDTLQEYIENIKFDAKKLRRKARKDDDSKKLKKYFDNIEESFYVLIDDLDEIILNYKRECRRKDKSDRCEEAKDVAKAFEKLEDAFDDLGDEF